MGHTSVGVRAKHLMRTTWNILQQNATIRTRKSKRNDERIQPDRNFILGHKHIFSDILVTMRQIFVVCRRRLGTIRRRSFFEMRVELDGLMGIKKSRGLLDICLAKMTLYQFHTKSPTRRLPAYTVV